MNPLPQILRILKTMPPLPNVAHRVLQIVQDPEYSIDELIGLVRTDPSLVARILRFCNSARNGLENEVTSVADAVTYLGTRNLVQLVLVTCSASMFSRVASSTYADPEALWRHSFACAVGSQVLAKRCQDVAAETAFTVGILHNVGKVALSQASNGVDFARTLSSLNADPTLDHIQLERRLFGIDHATASGVVADTWQLPEALGQAMRAHHDETLLGGASSLPAILHVADQLALQQGIGNPFPTATVRCSPTALTKLGLDDAALAAVTACVAQEMQQAAELLNLEVVAGR